MELLKMGSELDCELGFLLVKLDSSIGEMNGGLKVIFATYHKLQFARYKYTGSRETSIQHVFLDKVLHTVLEACKHHVTSSSSKEKA